MAEPTAPSESPLIETLPVPACVVCGADDGSLVARGRDYELQTCANDWLVMACPHCSHAWLNPRPVDAALPVIYPSHYYSYDMSRRVGSAVMRIKSGLDRRKLAKAFAHLRRVPGRFFDIGCGDGRYLSIAQSLGVPRDGLYGIEMGAAAALTAHRSGFRVEAGNADTFDGFAGVTFDAVSMFHVIEHLADPRRAVARIRSWLSPDGLMLIETPNRDALDARWFEASYWGGYHFPRHWHFFTEQSMRKMLGDERFKVIDISYQTGHSFWLYSIHHLLKYNATAPMPWLARRFDPLSAKVSLAAATAWDLLRSAAGFRTSSMLIVARRAP